LARRARIIQNGIQPSDLQMTSATPTSRRAIGNFNGDFDELAALIQRSWSENKEQPLLYTSEFLRSQFEQPGASFELAPAIYRDGKLVAFVAGFPRNARVMGESGRLLSVSYLTVAPEFKRFGFGPLIWGELLQRARTLGFDGAVDFTVEGDPWSKQILAVARALRQPTVHIFDVPFMARLLKEGDGAASVDEAKASGALLKASSGVAGDVARVWSQAEAEWQCQRLGAVNAVTSVEGRGGMMNGYAIETSGAAPMLCVIVDNILWGDLVAEERGELVRCFIGKAAQSGARMITTPVLGYADMQPLVGAGFRKTRRRLHAYLTAWGFVVPKSVGSMYWDVF
jgi:hypothetical protein